MIGKLATAVALGAALIFASAPADARGPGGAHFGGGGIHIGGGGGPRFGGGGPRFGGAGMKFSGPRFHGGGIKYGGKHFGGGKYYGGGKHYGGYGGRPRYRGRYWRYYAYGVPLWAYDGYYDGAYYDGYYGGCSYLWRRYLRTGNPKWKYRYYDCID
jgi:hypothetical protein